jgi:hypothetical protein
MELLNEDRQSELLAQPESGMGYQIVDVVLRSGERRRGTAFNGEFLLYAGEPPSRLKNIFEPSKRSLMFERKELGLGEEIVEISVIPNDASATSRVREIGEAKTALSSTGANEAPEEDSQADEQFKRFSAYPNDRRVTPGRWAVTRQLCHDRRGREASQDRK